MMTRDYKILTTKAFESLSLKIYSNKHNHRIKENTTHIQLGMAKRPNPSRPPHQ